MLRLLALTTVTLTAADHWTTYLCLRRPIQGWSVIEANPIAEWLFESAGLLPGLMIDTAITVVAVGFLLLTPRFPRAAKLSFLAVISLMTGYAVVNNVQAIQALGLSPLGVG